MSHVVSNTAPRQTPGAPTKTGQTGPRRHLWAVVCFSIAASLAAMCWLATGLIWVIGHSDSASQSENMNPLVLFLLPAAVTPAVFFTDLAALIAPFVWRSALVRSLGVLALAATVLAILRLEFGGPLVINL